MRPIIELKVIADSTFIATKKFMISASTILSLLRVAMFFISVVYPYLGDWLLVHMSAQTFLQNLRITLD